MSEIFLDLSTILNDDNLSIVGNELARCNHPSNFNPSGVCIYSKNSCPDNILDIRFLQKRCDI